MDFSGQSSTVIFVCSFFAIVPLAALLGFATEELALRVGDAFGGLLNATFGNAVELIIAILALIKGELNVVRSAMLGSILSNCLLVMGGSFFAGGIRFHEQGYSIRAAQLNINLLGISGESLSSLFDFAFFLADVPSFVAVVAIVVPTAFHSFLEWNKTQDVNQTVSVESLVRIWPLFLTVDRATYRTTMFCNSLVVSPSPYSSPTASSTFPSALRSPD